MRLKSIVLENYGPFAEYQLDFPSDDRACILLTGKNNAGKSSIIRALKLLGTAMKHAKRSSQPMLADFTKQDIEDIDIGQAIHNYKTNGIAVITGVLDTNRQISVYLNSENNTASFELPAYAHRSMVDMFGFIPQLGQLAEKEPLVTREHVLRSLNTTLAPRHLRNHMYHLLGGVELNLIKNIINDSWEGIEIQDLELDQSQGILYCLYKEYSLFHELAWAGQGLQIWFQIITHMVRLVNKSTLVLDEPELFLHPKKQHDLIRVLSEYYDGSVIIATHSSELMNDVDISHIIHVQKNNPKNKILPISDRIELEKIRSNIGSGFNLIASQFEDVEILIATEYQLDYDVVHQLAVAHGITEKTQNVRISGFSNYMNALHFKQAYSMFFGKQIRCSLLLDRDYYPQEYLNTIKEKLTPHKVKLVFTPGKEIENLFLEEEFLETLISGSDIKELHEFLDNMYNTQYDDCFSKYLEFCNQFSSERKNVSITYRDLKPSFDVYWNDREKRHHLIPGKSALAKLRVFFKDQYNITLTTSLLIKKLVDTENITAKNLVTSLFS